MSVIRWVLVALVVAVLVTPEPALVDGDGPCFDPDGVEWVGRDWEWG